METATKPAMDYVNSPAARLKGDFERVKADFAVLKGDLARLAQHGKAAGKATGARVGKHLNTGKKVAAAQIDQAVGAKPLMVIGGALALGLVVGVLVGLARQD